VHFVKGLYYLILLTSDFPSPPLTPTPSPSMLSLSHLIPAPKLTGGHATGTLGFEICLCMMLAASVTVHSKKCWVVLTQLWVKYGLTQPLG